LNSKKAGAKDLYPELPNNPSGETRPQSGGGVDLDVEGV
jgi:hypothetical protein